MKGPTPICRVVSVFFLRGLLKSQDAILIHHLCVLPVSTQEWYWNDTDGTLCSELILVLLNLHTSN